jgi:hypothetical protein
LALKKGLDRAYFSIGQLSGEVRDPDCPALEVMTAILGGGADSRLYQRLLTKMGDANAIAADWDANYGHPGAFRISGAVKSPSTVEDIRAIREEVERMRSAEVSAEELAAAKNTAINRLAFAYDTNAKAVGRMLGYAYFGYPEDFIQQYQKALAAVTAADVLRVAKEHLDPARFAIVVVGNPAEFLNPLSSLGGPVRQIDSTIPGAEAAPADAAGLAKGKQMIERAQQAVGGADKLAAIQDIAQVSEARPDSPPDAAPIQATELWLAPDAFRREQSAPTGKIVVYLNGRSGWASPPAGTAALTGVRLKEVEGDRFRLYFRLLLGDRMPGWTVNAIDDATLEIADGAGQIAQLTVDPASGMPRSVRYELVMASGPPLAMADTWSDFREAAGVKMPYKIVRARNGVKYAEFTVTDCKINSGLKLEDLRSRP